MPTDQTAFYRSIREMLGLTANNLLIDLAPSETVHNQRAAILRHGLRVCSFSSLETYFESRFGDLLEKLGGAGLPFPTFSPKLQEFLIVDGVVGLANRTSFLPKSDRLAYIDKNLRDISTFAAGSPILTTFGFSPRGSNVNEKDLETALKAFELEGPWTYLTSKSGSIGGGASSLRDNYIKLAKDRNTSAHNPTSQIPSNDLQSHLQSVLTIGVTFDIALTKISGCFDKVLDFNSFKTKMSSFEPTVRFLDRRVDGRWDERSQSAGKSLKIHLNEQSGVMAARQRSNVQLVVIRDEQKRPIGAKC